MRELIKKYLPEGIKRSIKGNVSKVNILRDYLSDFNKFVKYSASVSFKNRENLESYLIKEYHAIEKGLTLSTPKKGFGIVRIDMLMDHLDLYQQRYGDDEIVRVIFSVLKEYRDFNEGFQEPNYQQLRARIDAKIIGTQETSAALGGTKIVTKGSILSKIDFDFESFVKSRHSVRDFTDDPVSSDVLIDAINIARFTPSVCNRQAWRVTMVEHTDVELMSKLLAVQNGNRGFGERIKTLLVITGKLSSFYDYERNQVFIDGGMFAMTLLLAVHSKGLGACCLNMSVNSKRGKDFVKALGVGEEDVPIMYIAVGHLKNEFRVAKSQRKETSEIVIRR